MSQAHDGRLVTFDVGDDEALVVGAISEEGRRRTIYQGREPDEYALVPTREFHNEDADVDAEELRVDDLRILGPTQYVRSSDDIDVSLTVDGETAVEQGAAGVYGLLWIPVADL